MAMVEEIADRGDSMVTAARFIAEINKLAVLQRQTYVRSAGVVVGRDGDNAGRSDSGGNYSAHAEDNVDTAGVNSEDAGAEPHSSSDFWAEFDVKDRADIVLVLLTAIELGVGGCEFASDAVHSVSERERLQYSDEKRSEYLSGLRKSIWLIMSMVSGGRLCRLAVWSQVTSSAGASTPTEHDARHAFFIWAARAEQSDPANVNVLLQDGMSRWWDEWEATPWPIMARAKGASAAVMAKSKEKMECMAAVLHPKMYAVWEEHWGLDF
jgi:hypothetical protein